ncbi:MAG: PEGA domain-containing protein [Myxococcota bacterium]
MLTSLCAWAKDDAEVPRKDPKEAARREGEDEPDDDVTRARRLFREGAALAGEGLWAQALARYERADALSPHASIAYNIGVCERALGHGTRARRAFERALKRDTEAEEPALAESTRTTIDAYRRELEGLMATLTVTLVPASATMTIDGRPLTRRGTRWVAGLAPPGPATTRKGKRRVIEVDPGLHVIVVKSPGFEDVVLRETLAPGADEKRDLTLARLPGELQISADRKGAAVSVDGVDVGLAPVSLRRPAGAYHVEVRKAGFEPYLADVRLKPASEVALEAVLAAEEVGLHERWWFWTSIGAALAGAAVVTYFVVRPEPTQPPLDGGGLGWTVRLP